MVSPYISGRALRMIFVQMVAEYCACADCSSEVMLPHGAMTPFPTMRWSRARRDEDNQNLEVRDIFRLLARPRSGVDATHRPVQALKKAMRLTSPFSAYSSTWRI